MKLRLFDSSYFCCKSHFEDNGSQNYSVFQPVYRYIKKIANNDHISVGKSKEFSDKIIKPSAPSNNGIASALTHIKI